MPPHQPDRRPAGPAPASPVETISANDRWTVGRLITWTTDYLRDRGSESPRLDAEVLLAHVLQWARVQLYTHYDNEVEPAQRSAFRELVRRRAAGTPVAYLVGRKEFYSLSLHVNPSVLIPRPDTETLVAEFLTRFKGHPGPRGLDLGTGSGAIALACVDQHPTAQFLATDLSAEALEVARANADRLKLSDRVRFQQGDLYQAVADEPPFDAILANPPYIPTEAIATLDVGVRDHEPRMALDGGPDGLAVVRRIIAGAAAHLVPGGLLLLEIGTAQEQPVRRLIEAEPDLQLAPTIRDAANHPRVLSATRRPGH
ncbi:MAG: release factor glutamine methyltransferase [Isosphaeraceae bacterium]|jgi:release factor glutamine methyltransferase|nr:MAG: release factor glutamine methyltransferase [Isosphaeraceae bacterium]